MARRRRCPRYSHVEADGHYDAARQILIDNMVDAAGAGYYVITPFALQGGGWVLVNRGWVPLGRSRAERPAIRCRGRCAASSAAAPTTCPVPVFKWGYRRRLAPPYPVVAAFPKHAELAQLLRRVELDRRPPTWCCSMPISPTVIVRHWAPPGFPPLRHIAYAVQWFALALALFVIYVVTNFRRARGRRMTAPCTTRKSAVIGACSIGLALMFFAPLGLSFYLYYGHGTWRPGGRVNAGD